MCGSDLGEVIKTPREQDRAAKHSCDFEIGQALVIQHPIKFQEADHSEQADQQPKQDLVAREHDQQSDCPKRDRADEPKNENGTPRDHVRVRLLQRRSHVVHHLGGMNQAQAQMSNCAKLERFPQKTIAKTIAEGASICSQTDWNRRNILQKAAKRTKTFSLGLPRTPNETKSRHPARVAAFFTVTESLISGRGQPRTLSGSTTADPRISYLLATVCGARLLTSICALTFWSCAPCSFSCAVRTSIPFCCWATVDFNSAIAACCSSTFLCSLRNSLSSIAFTIS